MITADQHTHSLFSSDSDATPESMLQGAIEKKLTHLCLTDHMDYDYPGTTDEKPLFVFSPEAYFSTLHTLRAQCPDHFFLGTGVELGLRPNRPDLTATMQHLISSYAFDFVLGSVHLIGNEDPYYESYWQNHSPKNVLPRYFNTMLAALTEYDNFDSLGHLDYLIRYIPAECGPKDYVYKEYAEVIDEILLLLVQKNKALEINTAGLIKGLPCFHPKLDVLNRYRELGGQLLTIGSDAHSPDKLATEFAKTEELLRSCGFTGYYVYKKRIPEFVAF